MEVLVTGFVHEVSNSISLDIPSVIIKVIVSFYCIIERFTDHGHNLYLDRNNKNLIKVKTPGIRYLYGSNHNSVYGNYVIDITDESITEYHWKLKYVNKSVGNMIFGTVIKISSCGDRHKDYQDFKCQGDYGFSSDGVAINAKRKIKLCNALKGKGVINLKLNVDEKELSVQTEKNGSYYRIGKGIDLNRSNEGHLFNLAISVPIHTKKTRVELLSFKIVQR